MSESDAHRGVARPARHSTGGRTIGGSNLAIGKHQRRSRKSRQKIAPESIWLTPMDSRIPSGVAGGGTCSPLRTSISAWAGMSKGVLTVRMPFSHQSTLAESAGPPPALVRTHWAGAAPWVGGRSAGLFLSVSGDSPAVERRPPCELSIGHDLLALSSALNNGHECGHRQEGGRDNFR